MHPGDSAKTVPKFTATIDTAYAVNDHGGVASAPGRNNKGVCNVVFIDGNHEYNAVLTDTLNSRALANPSDHILIFDGQGACA